MKDARPICVGAIAGLAVLVSAHSCGARAQPIPSHVAARLAMGSSSRATFAGQDMSAAVVLARIVAKESGFASPQDIAPTAAVLLRVGRGDVVRGARIYSPRAFFPQHLGRRPYLAFLRADGKQPRMWPRNMAWSRYAPGWLDLVARSRAFLDGSSASKGCPEQPDHFGAPNGVDHERAIRAGWRRLDCGPTASAFWRVPR